MSLLKIALESPPIELEKDKAALNNGILKQIKRKHLRDDKH